MVAHSHGNLSTWGGGLEEEQSKRLVSRRQIRIEERGCPANFKEGKSRGGGLKLWLKYKNNENLKDDFLC